MQLSTLPRVVAIPALIAATLAVACLSDGGDTTPEPSDRYCGISYPLHSDSLPKPRNPVWLVGVDGATWDVIRPLVSQGRLPNIASLMEGGASGTMVSEEPTISPAIWATIATGVPRHVHGVDNFVVKPPGRYTTQEVGSLDRRSPAVWDLVGAAGGRSTVISWFGSFPAEKITGQYVSEDTDPAHPEPGQVHPPELAELLAERAVVRLPNKAFARIGKTDFLRETLLKDARTMAVLEALDPRESDLVAVYFSGIDVVQHVTWKHMDPDYVPFPGEEPRSPELAEVIPAYYEYIDHLLGRILNLMPEEATLVVVSDHGGGPMLPEQAFHLRVAVLLEILGYTAVDSDTGEVDWSRTRAFSISERYRRDKHVWLNIEGVEQEGTLPASDARAAADELKRALGSLRTDTGEPVFRRIRDDTANADWRPGQPALTVEFADAALYASSVVDGAAEHDFDRVRMRFADVSGGHRLEGIHLMRGSRIRPGVTGSIGLYNVAPTLLWLLDVPQDARMLHHQPADGGVLTSFLVPGEVEKHPVLMVAAYPGTDRTPRRDDRDDVPPDPARAASLERLRGLGYVD